VGSDGGSTLSFYANSSSSAFASDEVAGGEAFGERRVDRGEEVARFDALALIAPEAGEARRGAQLERAGTLLAGDGEGAVIAGGRLVGGAAGPRGAGRRRGGGGRRRSWAGPSVRRWRDPSRPCPAPRRAGRRPAALRPEAQKSAGAPAWPPVSAESAMPSMISGSAPASPRPRRGPPRGPRARCRARRESRAPCSARPPPSRVRAARATSPRNQWTPVSWKSADARLYGSLSLRERVTDSPARASAASGWPRYQRFHAEVFSAAMP